jgi:hypothetical protein
MTMISLMLLMMMMLLQLLLCVSRLCEVLYAMSSNCTRFLPAAAFSKIDDYTIFEKAAASAISSSYKYSWR